jgi:alpha-glucosidase
LSPWWRGAVFYEIYVRSFADSNDDGIGDLPGITSRLDYLKRLGVDAVWLTPFYPSPQKDQGYDVADYYDVNPEYGTLADFDQLVARARELRLKVLCDLVPNHTSDQHPWFQAALTSDDDPHRGFYHFADGKPDGSPPNNWRSAFGGPAWTRDERSGQWYLHLFAPEQPDLNWWNPEVPAEFERILRFWLDRGADGYRIDVASALFKRKDLADVPMVKDPLSGMLRPDRAFLITDQPQVHDVYRRWRQILNEYQPPRVLVGEIFEPQRQSRYILPDQLNMAFALMAVPWDAHVWRRSIDVDMHALRGPGVAPTWTLSNHDVVRHVTRFGGGSTGRERARAALLLLLGLPGQVVLYQGEELGLEEVDVPPEARQDPLYIHTEGKHPGRDGCRVPLPWKKGEPNAGFSLAAPWLPMPPGWDAFAVAAEASSATSMLSFYKRALAVRRRLAPWLPMSIGWQPTPAGVLAYQRERLKVACNFLSRPVTIPATGRRLLLASAPLAVLEDGCLTLPANSAAWVDAISGA